MNSSLYNPDNFAEAPAPERYMLEAVHLALRGRWAVAPNPCVGAVLVKDDVVVGRGWHKYYGGPHAEVEAIEDARQKGANTAECTLYVTLEPCNHTGKTPPCTRAILKAGIKRVVIGAADPDPNVDGGGAEFLRSKSVAVELGLAALVCKDLIADFTAWRLHKRSYTILKLAATLDGKIATRTGHSQWVSGPASRAETHRLRAKVGALVIGGNTFYGDNPQLTCRISIEGERQQPLAVVVTSRLPEVGAGQYLIRKRAKDSIFWIPENQVASPQAEVLREVGARVWGLPPQGSGLHLETGFQRLFAECNCLYALVEGGGVLASSLLEAGLVDEFLLFLAPKVIGDASARNLFSGRAVDTLDQALDMRVDNASMCGEDLLVRLLPRGR